jgi:uncharacterized membrane protein
MSDVPVQLIVAAFQDEGAAKEVLKALKALKRKKMNPNLFYTSDK